MAIRTSAITVTILTMVTGMTEIGADIATMTETGAVTKGGTPVGTGMMNATHPGFRQNGLHSDLLEVRLAGLEGIEDRHTKRAVMNCFIS